MPLFVPNAFSSKPNLIEDSRQFSLGMENELTHNKKVNNNGTALVSATSYTDLGDRVDSMWANNLTDKCLVQIGFSGLYIATSGAGNLFGAIFIAGNQLKYVQQAASPIVNEYIGAFNIAGAAGKQWMTSHTDGLGMRDALAASVTSGITTGMAVAIPANSKGGLANIILPAAQATPFSVGIRWKVSAGSVTISERKLWVRVCAMTN